MVVTEEKELDVEEQSFEELGLDSRLIRALSKKSIQKPTPIQSVAIPLILVCFCFESVMLKLNLLPSLLDFSS